MTEETEEEEEEEELRVLTSCLMRLLGGGGLAGTTGRDMTGLCYDFACHLVGLDCRPIHARW